MQPTRAVQPTSRDPSAVCSWCNTIQTPYRSPRFRSQGTEVLLISAAVVRHRASDRDISCITDADPDDFRLRPAEGHARAHSWPGVACDKLSALVLGDGQADVEHLDLRSEEHTSELQSRGLI